MRTTLCYRFTSLHHSTDGRISCPFTEYHARGGALESSINHLFSAFLPLSRQVSWPSVLKNGDAKDLFKTRPHNCVSLLWFQVFRDSFPDMSWTYLTFVPLSARVKDRPAHKWKQGWSQHYIRSRTLHWNPTLQSSISTSGGPWQFLKSCALCLWKKNWMQTKQSRQRKIPPLTKRTHTWSTSAVPCRK